MKCTYSDDEKLCKKCESESIINKEHITYRDCYNCRQGMRPFCNPIGSHCTCSEVTTIDEITKWTECSKCGSLCENCGTSLAYEYCAPSPTCEGKFICEGCIIIKAGADPSTDLVKYKRDKSKWVAINYKNFCISCGGEVWINRLIEDFLCEHCPPHNKFIKYNYINCNWRPISFLKRCEGCDKMFWIKSQISKFRCKSCPPIDENIRFRYDHLDQWVEDKVKVKCIKCNVDEWVSPYEVIPNFICHRYICSPNGDNNHIQTGIEYKYERREWKVKKIRIFENGRHKWVGLNGRSIKDVCHCPSCIKRSLKVSSMRKKYGG